MGNSSSWTSSPMSSQDKDFLGLTENYKEHLFVLLGFFHPSRTDTSQQARCTDGRFSDRIENKCKRKKRNPCMLQELSVSYAPTCWGNLPKRVKLLLVRNISCWIKKLVLLSQAGLSASTHDVRKGASNLAFLRNL